MDPLLLFILSFSGLVILIKWRQLTAQKKLEGISIPESINPQHPEGVLYYFYQPHCGPCRQMQPAINELREKYPDRVEKFNIADCREMVFAMGISATPTIILVKDNKIAKAIIGPKSAKNLESLLLAGNF